MRDEKTEYMNLLALRAAKGDESAFETLVVETQRLVYNLAYRSARNEQDALDISQEVYVKAWRSLASFRGDCSFLSWIFRITQNACVDFARRGSRNGTVSLTGEDEEDDRAEYDVADASETPDAAAERAELRTAVGEALRDMSAEHREMIILRDIEGYSYTEISDMEKIDIGTVKSRINRARGKLREILVGKGLV